MKQHRLVAFTSVLALLAVPLAGCGGSGSDSSSAANVITAFNAEPANPLIPGDTNESGGGRPIDLLFAGLISFDNDGKAHNEVAESITANDDASQYDIKLKSGWKFTDGTPVTAESFTKAWSYTANAKNAQLCSGFFANIKGYDKLQDTANLNGDEQLEGLKVINDHEFTVELSQPDSVFPIKVGYCGFYPLPQSFYKDPKAFGEKPVGDGPYKFGSWIHDQELSVVKNTAYHGNREAKNDGVTFRVYTDPSSAYADVQAGNLDVLDTIPSADAKIFQTDSSVEAYNKAGSVLQTITIPSQLEHWQTSTEEGQLRRRALSMAIDRSNICKKVLSNLGTPADSFTSPKVPGYSGTIEGHEYLEYNPTKAKELWNQAEAISHYDGKLQFFYNSDGGAGPVYDAIVNSVKNVLGIDAATSPIPTFQEFRNDVTARKLSGAIRTSWQPDYPSPQDYLVPLYDSSAADSNGSNDGDYKNAEFDELCARAASTGDEDTANDLYRQAQRILLSQLPSIPLYYGDAAGVASKDVKNFTMNWQNVPAYQDMTKR